MMHKHTLAPRIFTFVLSIAIAMGALCAWAGPALANDDEATDTLLTADSQDSEKKDKAEKPEDKVKANPTHTLTYSDKDGNEEQEEYDTTSADGIKIKSVDLYKKFYGDANVNADDLSVKSIDPSSSANVTYDEANKEFTIKGDISSSVTVTFNLKNDNKDYPITISCNEGKPWDGDKEAESEAIYGQSGTVDLKDCLPKDSSVTYGSLVVTDDDSVLDVSDGKPAVADGKLSFAFKNEASNAGKTAKVVVPVSVTDKSYAPYKIAVTLTVLDKQEQHVTAQDVEGTVGDDGASIGASTDGDGDLSYSVLSGKDVVAVDSDGNLTLKKEGEATVRITASETDTYKQATTDITVTVSAKPTMTYTVLLKDDGHGTATATPGEAEAGTKITLTATPDDGYEFDRWEVVEPKDGVTIKNDSFKMPESDVEIKANFKKKAETRSITFKANGGSGTMSKQTAEKGSTVTLKANTFKRTGYTFTGWNTKKDGSGTTFKNKAKVKLNANATLYAQWKKNSSSNNSSSKKSSSSSSSSGSSSSSLAQTSDPNDFGLMAGLAAGGGALVCAGFFANRKRGKGAAEANGKAENE